MPTVRFEFQNNQGQNLSARLELPLLEEPKAYAIFAHVFTGNKNLIAARHISRGLTLNGIAVLRFDFTGLGQSEGDFADTNFSSNVDDILSAAEYLEKNYAAPEIIIGHSLGGAASIFAAHQLSSVKAVATIGAPSEPEHVTHLLQHHIKDIEEHGFAEVNIDQRSFVIKKQFLEDIRSKEMSRIIRNLDKAILVMHSPQDGVVEIENAAEIYKHAKHPKSFVTLNGANHMLTNKDDAYYAGNVIASWMMRYIEVEKEEALKTTKQVVARSEMEHLTTDIMAGRHGIIADASESLGGNDFGPSPYELLAASLAACSSITMKSYAAQEQWPLEEVEVHISYNKNYFDDCNACHLEKNRLNYMERIIKFKGYLNPEQKAKLLEVANSCPVYKTLVHQVEIKDL